MATPGWQMQALAPTMATLISFEAIASLVLGLGSSHAAMRCTKSHCTFSYVSSVAGVGERAFLKPDPVNRPVRTMYT